MTGFALLILANRHTPSITMRSQVSKERLGVTPILIDQEASPLKLKEGLNGAPGYRCADKPQVPPLRCASVGMTSYSIPFSQPV